MFAFYFADLQTLAKIQWCFCTLTQRWMDNHRVPRHRARNWANFWTTANSQKKVKFVPPDWITQGEWNWLTHFDAEKYMFLFLEQFPSFRRGAMQVWSFKTGAIEVLRAAAKETFAGFLAEVELLRGTATESNIRDRNIFEWGKKCHQHAGKFHLVAPAFFVKPVFSCETWRASLREKSEKFHEINLSYQSFWKNSISTQKSSLCQMLTLSRNLDSNLSISFLISATEVFAEKKNSCVVKLRGHLCFYTCSVSCHQLVSRMQNLSTLNFTRLACWPRYWLYISCIYLFYVYLYVLINEGLTTTVANCGHFAATFFFGQFATKDLDVQRELESEQEVLDNRGANKGFKAFVDSTWTNGSMSFMYTVDGGNPKQPVDMVIYPIVIGF